MTSVHLREFYLATLTPEERAAYFAEEHAERKAMWTRYFEARVKEWKR